jgi:hypothetical protein
MINALTINDILETIQHLPFEDQKMVADIIQKRLIEQRRKEMAENAKSAFEQYKRGELPSGTLEDLEKELLSET